jgi:hypothetical protein
LIRAQRTLGRFKTIVSPLNAAEDDALVLFIMILVLSVLISTDTGGLIVGYRYHFDRWLAAEANYGYDRNTQQNFTSTAPFDVQANVHQATADLVVTLPGNSILFTTTWSMRGVTDTRPRQCMACRYSHSELPGQRSFL